MRILIEAELTIKGDITPETVIAWWRAYCGDELLTGKEMAEDTNSEFLDVALSITDARVTPNRRLQGA